MGAAIRFGLGVFVVLAVYKDSFGLVSLGISSAVVDAQYQ